MRILLSFYFILFVNIVFSQTKLSHQTNQYFKEINFKLKGISTLEIDEKWLKKHLPKLPIYKVNGEYCLSTIAKTNSNFSNLINNIYFTTSVVGDIATLKIPLKNIQPNLSIENIEYLEIAPRIQAENNNMIEDVRADSVWAGIDLPQAFTGKDVLIGITDWGFDYEHPMFMDTSLTESRIRAAWDQFKLGGTPPTGKNYGAVYETPQELTEAKSDTFGTYYGYATHGSHVAGIAGGSGAGTPYRGVAFDAKYLFNSIQLDVGAAIDAFVWMKSIADEDGKRLIINMSWGLYYIGSLDGNSLLSQAINNLSEQGVLFVTSAGNNGSRNFHLKKEFNNDTITSRIVFYGYNQHPNMWGQSISMWGEEDKPFYAQFLVQNNFGVTLENSPIFNTLTDEGFFDTILIVGADTIFYNLSIESNHPFNNRNHIHLKIKNENNGLRIVLKSFAENGTVHYWNVVELDNGVGNWGLAFQSSGTHGVNGDNMYGIGEPAATESVITVAAHVPQTFNASNQVLTGNIANFSSQGPLYNGAIKPDISAPGVNIVSSINPYYTGTYNTTTSINFNNKVYDFAEFSGTSMSSPAVAGVCALIWEANPKLSPIQIKEIIKATARLDDKTDSINAPGSPIWGMGKLNAHLAVDLALKTEVLTISEFNINDLGIMIYPNPSENNLFINLDETYTKEIPFLVYDLEGKLIYSSSIQKHYNLNITNWNKGIYFIYFDMKDTYKSLKFIKN